MVVNALMLKTTMLQILGELLEERIAEVLDFALFLNAQRHQGVMMAPSLDLPTVPSTRLTALTCLVA